MVHKEAVTVMSRVSRFLPGFGSLIPWTPDRVRGDVRGKRTFVKSTALALLSLPTDAHTRVSFIQFKECGFADTGEMLFNIFQRGARFFSGE
jgi:hypothetical protein